MSDADDALHELIARIPPDIAGIANAWATKLPDVSRATVIAIALMIDRDQQRAAEYSEARNNVLEEAAQMVERMPRLRQISTEHVKSNGPVDFSAAIRALKEHDGTL